MSAAWFVLKTSRENFARSSTALSRYSFPSCPIFLNQEKQEQKQEERRSRRKEEQEETLLFFV